VELDKKLEALLTKKISLEKLKIEEEAIKTWKERIEQVIIKSNDFRSLEINIKNLLKFMETRLKPFILRSKPWFKITFVLLFYLNINLFLSLLRGSIFWDNF